MASIFDLDNEDEIDDEVDEFDFEDDFETNEYINDESKAVELISKIISKSQYDFVVENRKKRISNMLNREMLGKLKYLSLTNESQLQIDLSNICQKLYEGRKTIAIKDKALVGIGGKFSAGKSKFINSLLKTPDLLPENQNPTTSIATFIVKGSQDIRLYTNDNRVCSIDVIALNALTHSFYERYKIGFSSFVDCVIVSNENMPYEDIVFLDTPGYSKADSYEGVVTNNSDREKAKQQLTGVDYLIWLIDIENGEISTADIDFLKTLKIEKPILVILNKADKKTDSDIEATINKISHTLRTTGLHVYGVTAYSSLNSEEWGNNMIERFLDLVGADKKSKSDVIEKLKSIEASVSNRIEDELDQIRNESEKFYELIQNSNQVIEIKSLVDLYGEILEKYRNLLKCKTIHERNMEEINREIKKYYEE